jgi:rhodanese-related sulfurtransferase
MKTLTAQQFEEKFGSNDNAVVINVLDEESYNKEHIPGSISIPLESSDFVEQVGKKVKNDKAAQIVVYCAKTECPASEQAAEKLAEAGYTNVYDFEGGMKEWIDSGHNVESGVGTADQVKAGQTQSMSEKSGKSTGGCC